MRKPNICFCGPLDTFKETAVESKIREQVNYIENYFDNIYVQPIKSFVFTDPQLNLHVRQIEARGKVRKFIYEKAQYIPFMFKSVLPFLDNTYKVDLLDISFVDYAAFLTKMARWKKIPTVVNALGGDIVVRKEFNYGFRSHGINKMLVKSCLENAAHICTLSEFMKKLLVDMGVSDKKIDIIPTGVDTTVFRPGVKSYFREQYGLNDNPVVMYLGSIIPLKGVIHLIKAARLIKDAFPKVKFVFMHFYTDQKYLEQCWNLIDSLELKNDIFYLGSIPHRYISDVLSGCDVYMHASFSESLGRSILESMSCGKPVVVSNAGAMPEYVKDKETGFLASPGEPEEYAGNVIKLLDDSNLREQIGRNARELVENEYSLEITARNRLEMYRKLLS